MTDDLAERGFKGPFGSLRVTDIEDQPWFVGKDLCRGVGIKHHMSALRVLDETEKRLYVFQTSHGPQAMTVISEAAVYYIILRSHAAANPGTSAYNFRKWVTTEVLPSIRKTGSYTGAQAAPPALPAPAVSQFDEEVKTAFRSAYKAAYDVMNKVRDEVIVETACLSRLADDLKRVTLHTRNTLSEGYNAINEKVAVFHAILRKMDEL